MFETCPNCGAPSPKAKKISLHVAGIFVGSFDGYVCEQCHLQFLAPDMLDEAHIAIVRAGLFGIEMREPRLRQRVTFKVQSGSTSVEKELLEFSIAKPEQLTRMSQAHGEEYIQEAISSLYNASSK